MANSGIAWIDLTFDWCVVFLMYVASKIGISYEEVNIWLFCIIWPTLTMYQHYRIKYLKHKIKKGA